MVIRAAGQGAVMPRAADIPVVVAVAATTAVAVAEAVAATTAVAEAAAVVAAGDRTANGKMIQMEGLLRRTKRPFLF